MQRIVSGEGIQGLKASSDLPRNNSDNSEVMMSHSPSVAFGDAANYVENDGDGYNAEDDGGGMTDSHDSITTFEQQQDGNERQNTVSPSSESIPINFGGTAPPMQQQQQTPLSIISGLLPAVGLLPISRNDSRNSGVASFGSGLQRSHNSSRDWGWFEDVHHSDQSVNGSFTASSRTVRSKNDGATSTVASLGANKTSLPQHHLAHTRTGNLVHAGGIGNSGNEGAGTEGPNSRMDSSGDYGNQGDSSSDNRNSTSNRLRVRGRGETSNTASLLPTGNEMLVDETQEYLEPIIINEKPRDIENEAAVQAVTAPTYVLEESLSDQLLWKKTAGNRPPQPVEDRAFFEAQWAENFARSEVKYEMPTEVLTATTPVSLNPFGENFGTDGTGVIGAGTPVAGVGGVGGSRIGGGNHHNVADIVSSFVVPGGSGHRVSSHQNPYFQSPHQVVNSGSGGNLIVYEKGDNVFGTTVSKSFPKPSINGELVSGVDTVNISIASYRVVESEKRGKHAQFHVIYREGSIRDTTGVWKRYSDFQELSKKVTNAHEGCASVIANMSPLAITEEHDVEHLPNAITSWHLLKKRKRWYRCLDSGYLSLKAFLLERFLHDILFESSTPDLLREFVGIPPPR